jgi:cytochrome oxidase Cu insertion factor (SCO1/SenC/PrrC family)
MQIRYSGLLAAALLLLSLPAASAPAFSQSTKEGSTMPKVGDMAPDFTLKYFDGSNLKDVKLSDYRGKKNVVVAFYIFAFTGG